LVTGDVWVEGYVSEWGKVEFVVLIRMASWELGIVG